MMFTRSTLPMLAVLVMVLLLDTPRSAAQLDFYPATPFTPPQSPSTSPSTSTSTQEPDSPTVTLKLEVWNASKYPATDFRSEKTPPMFVLWPENLSYVKFEYYCEDTNHTGRLQNFVYKEGQGILVTRPYFDVGLVDRDFTPYFQHWQFWQVDIKRITCVLDCEYSDLQRLYAYRLKRNVFGIGLGYGVAVLVILQVAVIAFSALLWKCIQPTQRLIRILRSCISETPWSDCICDWLHLLLLVVIGFAMMEGVGHSDFFRWRSMLLYNTAVTYTYLTLFSKISSFLHQCAHILKRCSITDLALPKNSTPAAAGAKSGLSEDWRYQRIFGQFGVMVLMGIYLIDVDDDQGQGMDSLGGIVVAAIVVACIWSAGVSAVVAVRSVRVICKCLLPSALKLPEFFDPKTHVRTVSPQPASNVSTATPVPRTSRSKTM